MIENKNGILLNKIMSEILGSPKIPGMFLSSFVTRLLKVSV